MRTSSKKISPWFSARCPSLSSGLPLLTPGRSSGTTATPVPAIPLDGSTQKKPSVCVAMVPFDTQADF